MNSVSVPQVLRNDTERGMIREGKRTLPAGLPALRRTHCARRLPRKDGANPQAPGRRKKVAP